MLGFVLHLLGSELWLCFAAMNDTEQLISFDVFVEVGVAEVGVYLLEDSGQEHFI